MQSTFLAFNFLSIKTARQIGLHERKPLVGVSSSYNTYAALKSIEWQLGLHPSQASWHICHLQFEGLKCFFVLYWAFKLNDLSEVIMSLPWAVTSQNEVPPVWIFVRIFFFQILHLNAGCGLSIIWLLVGSSTICLFFISMRQKDAPWLCGKQKGCVLF